MCFLEPCVVQQQQKQIVQGQSPHLQTNPVMPKKLILCSMLRADALLPYDAAHEPAAAATGECE